MAGAIWRFDELLPHWDELILRAHIIEDSGRSGAAGGSERTLYMEAPLAAVRRPEDLIRDYAAGLGRSGEPRLPVGTVMFMGAIGAIGGIRPASRFQMSLEDPVLGRTLTHAYAVCALPIVT
jgi:hypothetical protein